MIVITGILKWIAVACVSTTTIAILVTGTLKIFNDVVFYFLDKIQTQHQKYFLMYKYLKVRRVFKKWIDENESKGIDVKKATLKDW